MFALQQNISCRIPTLKNRPAILPQRTSTRKHAQAATRALALNNVSVTPRANARAPVCLRAPNHRDRAECGNACNVRAVTSLAHLKRASARVLECSPRCRRRRRCVNMIPMTAN